MITIKQSSTADTRTCDPLTVSRQQLLESSLSHIADVGKALAFFSARLTEAASVHDYDKLSDIDDFYCDFQTKFKQHEWWDNHRRIHRHHLSEPDGIPRDVNLIDVLEYVADCVMAGMARSGTVREVKLDDKILQDALRNTVELLKCKIHVLDL